MIELLDEPARREVVALLAYAEDAAGGLMSPRFARRAPGNDRRRGDQLLRRQAKQQLETIYYAYVLDREQQAARRRLLPRALHRARVTHRSADVMRDKVVSVPDSMDQEEGRAFDQEARLHARCPWWTPTAT